MKKTVFVDLILLLSNVLLVVVLFQILPKWVAAKITGMLFVLLGLRIVIRGFKNKMYRELSGFYLALCFLVLAALPIYIMHWLGLSDSLYHINFRDTVIFISPIKWLHKLGNLLYVILIVGTLVDFLKLKRLG